MENLKRNCPSCDKILEYSNKYTFKNAVTKNSLCKSCGIKNTITDDRLKEMSNRITGVNNPMYGKVGNLNPFYGKKHDDETKKKITQNRNLQSYKTQEFKDKISKLNTGENNPMFGKTFYDVWVNKHGKDIADIKMMEYKNKQSKNTRGVKNPMYGKPSPQGSGNGWSGWYKGWFFRSIKELTYMIKIIERFDLNWDTAENKNYKIEYHDYKNQKRNYFPDFIINKKYLVEIKPKNLLKSDSVKRKKDAALNFCSNHGLIYKISTIKNLSSDELMNLYVDKKIKFTERYEKKFKEKFLK